MSEAGQAEIPPRLQFRSGHHDDGRPVGMSRKSYVKLLDTSKFRGWVAERGGEEEAMAFICAQVAQNATLKQVSEHYVVDFGLLWDFVNVSGERRARYEMAQRGMAEYHAGELTEIADALGEDGRPDPMADVKRDALRIKTRQGLMAAWNKERYGSADAQLGAGLENLAAVLQRISERKRAPIVKPIDIEDVQPIEGKNEEIQRQETAEEVLESLPSGMAIAMQNAPPRLDLAKYDTPADEKDWL